MRGLVTIGHRLARLAALSSVAPAKRARLRALQTGPGALVSALVLVVACSGSAKKDLSGGTTSFVADAGAEVDANPDEHIPRLAGPPRLVEGVYFVDEGAPDPLACRVDRDCIGDTVPDETGCCVRSNEAVPQTWVWHTWVTERRLAGGCDEVTCPPLPVQGMPDLCKLRVRCASQRCVSTCD
jgi:hypothetical protein